MKERISDKLIYPSKFTEVYGSKMHYIEAGTGTPILFLHGIPTSCYLWRNMFPHLSTLGRCIAPDLIGFGKSDKPDIKYTIFDHIKYIKKFIEILNLKKIILIMHGWGSVIGFDYAMNHEANCSGLVFYEAFLRSMDSDISLPLREQLIKWQNPEIIEAIVMNGTSFVDNIIPQNVMRPLTNDEMDYYRQPFQKKGTGKPITQYLRELPNGDEHAEINQLVEEYSKKLTKSNLPKLMLYSVPGFITTFATAMWAKEHLSNLEIVDLGEELHLAQESHPQFMAEAISVWLQGIEQIRNHE